MPNRAPPSDAPSIPTRHLRPSATASPHTHLHPLSPGSPGGVQSHLGRRHRRHSARPRPFLGRRPERRPPVGAPTPQGRRPIHPSGRRPRAAPLTLSALRARATAQPVWGRLAACFGYMPVQLDRSTASSSSFASLPGGSASASAGGLPPAGASSASLPSSSAGGGAGALSATGQIVRRAGLTGPWDRYPPTLVFPEGACAISPSFQPPRSGASCRAQRGQQKRSNAPGRTALVPRRHVHDGRRPPRLPHGRLRRRAARAPDHPPLLEPRQLRLRPPRAAGGGWGAPRRRRRRGGCGALGPPPGGARALPAGCRGPGERDHRACVACSLPPASLLLPCLRLCTPPCAVAPEVPLLRFAKQ